jgi:hypothetical protein
VSEKELDEGLYSIKEFQIRFWRKPYNEGFGSTGTLEIKEKSFLQREFSRQKDGSTSEVQKS